MSIFIFYKSLFLCRLYNHKDMAIKIKKPLCKKVEKIAKSGNKTKKKTKKTKDFSLSRKERIKEIKKQLRLK